LSYDFKESIYKKTHWPEKDQQYFLNDEERKRVKVIISTSEFKAL